MNLSCGKGDLLSSNVLSNGCNRFLATTKRFAFRSSNLAVDVSKNVVDCQLTYVVVFSSAIVAIEVRRRVGKAVLSGGGGALCRLDKVTGNCLTQGYLAAGCRCNHQLTRPT